MARTKDDTKTRFRRIITYLDTVTVSFQHYSRVSSRPLQSNMYANCNGVVLMKNGFAVLSHYDRKKRMPEEYIPEMMDELGRKSPPKDMTAVLIGGDTEHFMANRELLCGMGIKIVGEYVDGWMDDERFPTDDSKSYKYLVVIPSDQEVIMYSLPSGYRHWRHHSRN